MALSQAGAFLSWDNLGSRKVIRDHPKRAFLQERMLFVGKFSLHLSEQGKGEQDGHCGRKRSLLM